VHKFLRSIGFSEIRKNDLKIILEEVIERPTSVKMTKDSEGNEFAEFTKEFADGMGIIVRGSYDEEDTFEMSYYVPYSLGSEVTTGEQIDMEKHAEKESYAGVCDDVRLGVTLIFYIQNVADFLSEYRSNIYTKNIRGASLSALSVEGKILFPVQQKKTAKQYHTNKNEKRNQLIAQAREGNEEAIEHLTLADMDTYSSISRRLTKEDILSIVDSYFMPYGIESDQYSILGTITEVNEVYNLFTQEKIYRMRVSCNDMEFDLTMNEKDLLGEPVVGRRFKGNVWMQGKVCL
jgi:hypothetical protein